MLRFAPNLQSSFPQEDYTPFGYLYSPKHLGTRPDALFRSVEPLGFGFYRRGFGWYGMDALNTVNAYLSLLLPALKINGTVLAKEKDFQDHGITLISKYHSSEILSYDFLFDGVDVSLAWYTNHDNVLYCKVRLVNTNHKPAEVTVYASHAYGMNDRGWWGSDAITARYVEKENAVISKILAYGDVYALSSDLPMSGAGVTASEEERLDESQPSTPRSVRMPGPLYATARWERTMAAETDLEFVMVLVRSVNEKQTLKETRKALETWENILRQHLQEDDRFCKGMPTLEGDWPETWRRGMVYHFQTLRMNVMQPYGIFTHRWDGMQTANPRMVLGETCIDMLSLFRADPETALEVLTTTFEDSPDVYVPCCREDGSVNMIGMDGSECATALMWGFPFDSIRTIIKETGDIEWLRRIYPCLKALLAWWKENRTDSEGWYHCNNSWESGQDGSKRFVSTDDVSCKEAMNADHVRAVDLESTMAQSEKIMAEFASMLGLDEDAKAFEAAYQKGLANVWNMFFEDRFCDVNALTGKPFTIDAHLDPMLLMPLSTDQATEEQIPKLRWILDEMIDYVEKRDFNRVENGIGIFWPPIFQTFSKALHGSGDYTGAAKAVSVMLDTAWSREDSRQSWPGEKRNGIPDGYVRRIPGNARENLNNDIVKSGTENYGWGCIPIAMFFEHILGIHYPTSQTRCVELRPILPEWLGGEEFRVNNARLLGAKTDIVLKRLPENKLSIELTRNNTVIRKTLSEGECLTIEE